MSPRCLMLVSVFVVFINTTVSVVDVKKTVGDEVSFRPEPTPSYAVSSILWKQKSNNGVVVKAIEWDTDDGISIPNPRFKEITSLDKQTGEITITNLTFDHTGLYAIDVNSKELEEKFILTIMEPVPKPVIEIEKIDGISSVLYLRCEYREKIIWKNSAGEILEGSVIFPKGESITVKNEKNEDKFYTCTIMNGVSEETSDPVYERDLFENYYNFCIQQGGDVHLKH